VYLLLEKKTPRTLSSSSVSPSLSLFTALGLEFTERKLEMILVTQKSGFLCDFGIVCVENSNVILIRARCSFIPVKSWTR
jgi:hypothetical protein